MFTCPRISKTIRHAIFYARGGAILLSMLIAGVPVGFGGAPGTAQGFTAPDSFLPGAGLRAIWAGAANPSMNTLHTAGSPMHIVGGLVICLPPMAHCT